MNFLTVFNSSVLISVYVLGGVSQVFCESFLLSFRVVFSLLLFKFNELILIF